MAIEKTDIANARAANYSAKTVSLTAAPDLVPDNRPVSICSARAVCVSLNTLRRRANRKFGRGTVQLKGDSFVRLNTPGGVFEYASWDGTCGMAQSAVYRVDIPVVNMLIGLGLLRVTKLCIDSWRPGETRLPHKWETTARTSR